MNSTAIDETFKNFLKTEVKKGNGNMVKKLFGELDKLKQGNTPSILDNMNIDGLEENEKQKFWNASVEFSNQLQAEYGEQYFNNLDEVMRRTRVFQNKWIEDRKKATDVEYIGKVITLTHEEWIQREAEMCEKWENKKQLQNENIKKDMIENFTKKLTLDFTKILTIDVNKDTRVCEYKTLAISLFSKKMKSFTPTRVFEKDKQHFSRISKEVANEIEKQVRQADEKKRGDIYDLLCEEDSNKQIKKDTKKKQPVSKKKNICSCGNKNCEPRPPKERYSPSGIKINTKPLQEAWDRNHGKIPPLLQKI